MNGDLQRLKAIRGLANDVQESEDEYIAGVFGWLRGVKERSPMLELRLKSGDSDVFSYALLERVRYNRSTGITLQFGTNTIQISGEQLNTPAQANMTLFEGLLRHRITWIQESSQAESMASQAGLIVTRIRIE